ACRAGRCSAASAPTGAPRAHRLPRARPRSPRRGCRSPRRARGARGTATRGDDGAGETPGPVGEVLDAVLAGRDDDPLGGHRATRRSYDPVAVVSFYALDLDPRP